MELIDRVGPALRVGQRFVCDSKSFGMELIAALTLDDIPETQQNHPPGWEYLNITIAPGNLRCHFDYYDLVDGEFGAKHGGHFSIMEVTPLVNGGFKFSDAWCGDDEIWTPWGGSQLEFDLGV